jgi:NAD+ synthase
MNSEGTIAHITSWLSEYHQKSGTNGFVVGVSGGVDSALTSTLCALTGVQTLVLSMPIRQNKPELERAREHQLWLGKKFSNVECREIDLSEVFEAYRKIIPEDVQDWLSMANTRSRIRMTTLYAFAGNKKMLVAGTGNKVEDFGVGFFTKYGDGGVDISPIADLYKSEVFQLARFLGVPESILSAPPTDGLWEDGRTDEDQLGATYDELEWAMEFSEKRKSAANLSERQMTVLALYEKLNAANLHKMLPIPICRIPENLKK